MQTSRQGRTALSACLQYSQQPGLPCPGGSPDQPAGQGTLPTVPDNNSSRCSHAPAIGLASPPTGRAWEPSLLLCRTPAATAPMQGRFVGFSSSPSSHARAEGSFTHVPAGQWEPRLLLFLSQFSLISAAGAPTLQRKVNNQPTGPAWEPDLLKTRKLSVAPAPTPGRLVCRRNHLRL